MDHTLHKEILSLLKYFKNKSFIIKELNKRITTPMTIVDDRRTISKKIQSSAILYGRYGLRYAPSLDKKLILNIFNLENLENCLDICCKEEKIYLKVCCLMGLYYKRGNIKFMVAAVQLAMKFKFRKLLLFGLDILLSSAVCTNTDSLLTLKEEHDNALSEFLDLKF